MAVALDSTVGIIKLVRGIVPNEDSMYRRVVSLLLLPCVLLTQSAALGHCHGGNHPAGHDPRPHIHLNTVRHEPHGHRHGPGGHHHHKSDTAPATATLPAPQPEPPSDHDSDAIFFTDASAVPPRSAAGGPPGDSPEWATSWLNLSTTLPWAGLPQVAANWCHPPPVGRACPLYVRHLALLI